MVRKRKLDTNEYVQKSAPVEVIVEDVTNHPLCLHGPTLLFSSEKGRFFACSSCRNKKDCPVHIEEEDWQKESVRKRNEKYYDLIPKFDKAAAWALLKEVKSRHYTDRAYCNTCQELYIISTQGKRHLKDHRVFPGLTDEQLERPSTWLPALEADEKEAQYMFSKKAVSTILGILRNNHIKNVICIGTPSVHEAARAQAGAGAGVRSLLLDGDTRRGLFLPPAQFLHYNMFNNYLFNGNKDEKVLEDFIKKSKGSGVAVVLDPPFGGRVEPLVGTLRALSALYCRLCERPDEETIPVIWAFPYFAEPYIVNMMPEIKMHDYQVEYENHKKFGSGGGARRLGSAVRLFTSLPLASVELSGDARYKHCARCGHWVAAANRHCDQCRACTGKSGAPYRHCDRCARCVKGSYRHCAACGRCALPLHACGARPPASGSCFHCRDKGHKKSECPQLKEQVAVQKKKKRKNA